MGPSGRNPRRGRGEPWSQREEPAWKKTELAPGLRSSFPQQLSSGAVPNTRIHSGTLHHANQDVPFRT